MDAGCPLAAGVRSSNEICPLGQNMQTNGNRRSAIVWPNRRFQNGQNVTGAYALSFARPLARRLFKIRRPALVAIRARNPWRFLRTRLDGWNVRFIACSPVLGQILIGDSKPVNNSELPFRAGRHLCQRACRDETATIATIYPRQMFQSSRTKHAKLKHPHGFASMGRDVGIAKTRFRPSNLQQTTHP